jgi:hypothetical protein
VLDLSSKGIIFRQKELSFELKKDDLVTLEIVYEDFASSSLQEENYKRMDLKTRVYKINERHDIIVILIDSEHMHDLRKYVLNRQVQLLDEFKLKHYHN